jgi:hypothetical protein
LISLYSLGFFTNELVNNIDHYINLYINKK